MQRSEYARECSELNIKGEHIRLEIPRLMEQLPLLFRSFEGLFRGCVREVLGAYRSFCKLNGS